MRHSYKDPDLENNPYKPQTKSSTRHFELLERNSEKTIHGVQQLKTAAACWNRIELHQPFVGMCLKSRAMFPSA